MMGDFNMVGALGGSMGGGRICIKGRELGTWLKFKETLSLVDVSKQTDLIGPTVNKYPYFAKRRLDHDCEKDKSES